ncbi:MAG: homoserine dehydrogenase [Cellvibrionales bacterium TMED122]|nr:MAG: homoserine dehydrogenase [Cellvibrionales bacterium TMED122]
MSSDSLNIGVCGVGTVGLATMDILMRQAELLEARSGKSMKLVHVGARREHPDHNYGDARVSRDVMALAEDPEIDVLVELIGGTSAAYDLIKRAIQQGKHIVTANKALIAEHGNELIALAEASGVQIRFEAAVAGGIPIIKALREAMAGNEVTGVAGIINGTGNFILTEMSTKGRAFDEVLAEAQSLGYAEADPTFDIDGTDAAHKLVILASLAFDVPLDIESPFKQGIESLTPEDLDYAAEMGYRVKHLGIARRQAEGVEVRVHPTLIPESKQLATVDGVLNAVMVTGSAVGELVLVGPGAGGPATASSVCADIVDIARSPLGSGPALGLPAASLTAKALIASDDIASEWYVRLNVADRPGVMSSITQTLADRDISIESLVQKAPLSGQSEVPIVLLTHQTPGSVISEAIEEITGLPDVQSDYALLRVESFEH